MWPYWDDDFPLRAAILISIFIINNDEVILWNERAIKEEKEDLLTITPMSTNHLR